MKPKENPNPVPQPRLFIAITVLAMLISAASIVMAGLAPGHAPTTQTRPQAQSLSHPAHTKQSAKFGAVRAHIAQWAAYLARSA